MNLNNQFDKILLGEIMEEKEEYAVSSGAALLDLIVGGEGYGPFGKIVNLIGDSSAGKTFFACEAIYQAKKKFKDKLKVRYNDAESGFNFNTLDLYGYSMEPYVTQTPTIEGFSMDLKKFCSEINLKKGELGIYVVDSFDGLASDADIEEFEKRMDYHDKGKVYDKGTYDMSKQKFSSKLFRTMSQTIQGANVLLIIISQIRDNIGVSFGDKFTISGGKALKFYSTVRLFLKTVDKNIVEDRQIGGTVKCTGMKVRSKHPFRSINVNLLYEYGIDDVSTNIDYLYDLREDYGKLKEASVINNIAWNENAVEVSSETIKTFLEEQGKLDEVIDKAKEKTKRLTQKALIEEIKLDEELYLAFVEYFGVMDRDGLIQYVITTGKEQEMADKAVAKWLAVEERIKPIRNRKTLE